MTKLIGCNIQLILFITKVHWNGNKNHRYELAVTLSYEKIQQTSAAYNKTLRWSFSTNKTFFSSLILMSFGQQINGKNRQIKRKLIRQKEFQGDF